MDAIINLNKPEGMTSFQCVSAVRRILGIKKVGHAGTLDPEASGVLPICVGRATKLLEFFLLCQKSYRASILFGVATDTQDVWGQSLEVKDPSFLREERVQACVQCLTGEQEQTPPAYSAIKVKGIPMYKRARSGQASEVELCPRKIFIYQLQMSFVGAVTVSEKFQVPVREAKLDVTCSRGTYVRTLCYDIGRRLDCPACMSGLCRTSYGPFLLQDSITLEELEDAARAAAEHKESELFVNEKIAFYAPEYILLNFPVIHMTPKQAKRFRNGQETVIFGQQLSFGADAPLCPKPDPGIACLKLGDQLAGVVRFFVGTDSEEQDALVVKPWKYLGGDFWDDYCKKL